MLQQTTVATVTPRYTEFLSRFPTISSLAAASQDDVLHAWQGLGYYRRARLLHRCAQVLMEASGGQLPSRYEELKTLPGLGDYTASAVAAIAFDEVVIPVDGNVERVLARLNAMSTPPKTAKRAIAAATSEFRGETRAGDCAQALMELGALICRPTDPKCAVCPLGPRCQAFQKGRPEAYPVRAPKNPRPERYAVAFLLEHKDLGVLFRRRPENGLLGGMIELPSTAWQDTPWNNNDWKGSAPRSRQKWILAEENVRHVFTHFVLNVNVARAKTVSTKSCELWCRPEAFHELALPSLTRKLLQSARVGVEN